MTNDQSDRRTMRAALLVPVRRFQGQQLSILVPFSVAGWLWFVHGALEVVLFLVLFAVGFRKNYAVVTETDLRRAPVPSPGVIIEGSAGSWLRAFAQLSPFFLALAVGLVVAQFGAAGAGAMLGLAVGLIITFARTVRSENTLRIKLYQDLPRLFKFRGAPGLYAVSPNTDTNADSDEV